VTEPLFTRAPELTEPITDYEVLLAGIVCSLINADLTKGILNGADNITEAELEARITTATRIAHRIRVKNLAI